MDANYDEDTDKIFYGFYPQTETGIKDHVDSHKPVKRLSSKTQSKNLQHEFPTSTAVKRSVLQPTSTTVKKTNKVFKKKSANDYPHQRNRPLAAYSVKEYKQAKYSAKHLKKTQVQRNVKCNSVKKQACSSGKKISGDKIPGKGTLKRKRWFFEQLQQKNENYEDDLFEDQKFGHFQNLLQYESDNAETYDELKTPVFPFSLSPRETTPSPKFADCYSPAQLSISRKGAEEYHYRRMKRKKVDPQEKKEVVSETNQENKTEETVLQTLAKVAKLLNTHQSLVDEPSDAEEDQYFSDVLK